MSRKPNSWGCIPSEDVCLAHDEPLVNRVRCSEGRKRPKASQCDACVENCEGDVCTDPCTGAKDSKAITFTTAHAIVRGLAEHNDAGWFFGFTTGLRFHIAAAIAEGIVEADGDGVPKLTDQGRKLYATEIKPYNLPECRWYMWRL